MKFKFTSLFIAFAGLVNLVSAQVTTASISGLVNDADKESLPGATVKATHTPSGTVYYVATQSNGRFSISGMRIGGPYVVEVTYVGFNPEKITNLQLALGEDSRLNFTLKPDAFQLEEVVVIGEPNPAISSSRTGAQEIITRDKMEKLPSINRSLADFTKLTPMSSGNNFAGTSYRFNNVTVDGASFNNSFGLSSSLGASGTEPISLEALEQVQVMIAPFDVRNGAFTGAGINSVTKAGTNSWQGSAYYYMKHPSLEGRKQKDYEAAKREFKYNQFGLTVGGPIIKNKLFFFLNAEIDRQSTPINWQPRDTPSSAYNPENPNGISFADKQTLEQLKDFLVANFGFNPGSYEVKNTPTYADRITARIDWNINSKNTLSFKYFYLKSYNTNAPSTSGAIKNGRGPNKFAIPFSSAYYRTNNNFNIFMADLNTTINDVMYNSLKVGYSRLRDFRDMDGGFFPEVNIASTTGDSFTTFGTEANSYNNRLDTDIFQIQDNFTWTLGRHQLTFGTQSDVRMFLNGYANSFAGQYQYSSLQAFYDDVAAYKAWRAANPNAPMTEAPATNATSFRQVINMTDGEFPYARVNVASLGFYVQDKWSVTDNFNLTLGLRLDVPIFLDELATNEMVADLTFQGGRKVDTGKMPKTSVLLSPRVGFNWDVLGDKTLQLRGGTGIFSGTPPYVWISNQAGNNGLLFADYPKKPAFSGQTELEKPTNGSLPTPSIAITDENFKYPQLWKTNIAVDYKFLGGWVATAEFLYNKDINGLYHRNINLPDYEGSDVVRLGGADNRYFFKKTNMNSKTRDVVLLSNSNKGYSVYTTLQLQRNFTQGPLAGLYVNGSYTFGVSKSVTDGSSSVAYSAWRYRPAIDPNGEELGYAYGSFPNRLLLQAAYRREYAKHFASSLGVVYQMYMPFRYSYTYDQDLNGDGLRENDLVFVPETINDIRIVKDPGDTRTVEEIWNQMDRFIKQDPYLKTRRGQYTERNGGKAPYVHQIDLNFTQDFFLTLSNGKRNTVRFTFDIQNFANLLNKNWGVQQTTVLGYQQYQFLKVVEKPAAANNYTPGITMPLLSNGKALENTFQDYVSGSSRWSMMFGVKYMFN